LAQGDEFSQIITPITRQRPSEILHLLQNDFCNTIRREADIRQCAKGIALRNTSSTPQRIK
jgi:hypothetical protein